MELKYKTAISVVLLVLALTSLVLGIIASLLGSIVTGAILTVMAIMMLTRPMITLSQSSMGMKNLLGMEIRRYPLEPGNHEVRDNKIYVDGRKRASLWMFDADEATVRSFLDGPTTPQP